MKKWWLLTVLCTFQALAQAPAKQQILSALEQYFYLDRENIHVHFDKTIFFTEEDIWFQGYVFNKKANTPFFETTNVYAAMYDQAGNRIQEQLVFAFGGSFSGRFKLGGSIPSGVYYIHFFTNYMNNFTEDESAVYEIDVVNPSNPVVTDRRSTDRANPKIDVFPEGGQLIAGVINNVAIRVTDCNGLPLNVREVALHNTMSMISTVALDASGTGRTYVTPTAQPLSVSVDIDGKKHLQPFPPIQTSGIAMEVNTYALPGKTILRLRTTPDHAGKTFHCVIQQNEKINIVDATFDTAEKELIIANENLFPGTSIVRLIDTNLQQVAFRHVFRFPSQPQSASLSAVTLPNGTSKLKGMIPPKSVGSITVLPAGTESDRSSGDIRTAFWIDAYTGTRSTHLAPLLASDSKSNLYRIDLFMLTQHLEKYRWTSMMGTPPKLSYDFDIGLAITGSIGKSLPSHKNHRMCLRAPIAFVTDYTEVDASGNFAFRNIVFPDGSDLLFNLLKNPSTPQSFNLTYQVHNRARGFRKGFRVPASCARRVDTLSTPDMPDFAPGAIALDDVAIKKKKTILTKEKAYGNAMLRGVKVTDDNNHTDLLTYLGSLGFNVLRYQGRVDIVSTMMTSLRGQPTRPVVFVDGRQVLSFDELDPIHMQDVDEIYYDKQAIVANGGNANGIIKVYLRRQPAFQQKDITKKIHVKDAFAPMETYEPPLYSFGNASGFAQYGVVNWIPDVRPQETGEFNKSFEHNITTDVIVIMEGFAPDGSLIHEEQTFKLR